MYFNYYLLGIVVLPGILLAIYAQSLVNSTFNKYSVIASNNGRSAHEIARHFLDVAGLHGIQITRVGGSLTDYYNHRKKILALSETVYDSTSISAIGVACHEVGHALQFKSNYLPIKIRNFIIPICNFVNKFVWIFVIFGAIFYYTNLIWIGAISFALSVLVNLVTLPVEFNASKRAIQLLRDSETFTEEEIDATKKVLNAAALTYLAGFIVSLLNLLRFVLAILMSRRRD